MPADSLGIRGSVDIDVRGAQQNLKQLDQSIGGFSKRSVAAFGAIGAGIFALNKAGRGLASVVQGWAGVDQVMSVVGTKMGATTDQLAALRDEVKKVGLETTKTADESAEALDIMATAGLNADQALGSLMSVVQFSEATAHDMAASVKIASGALNVFKLEAEQLPQALNSIAAASNSSATTVGELGFALETSQGTWAETGDSLESLVASLGLLADVGKTGAKAGTQLARAVTELRNARTPEAAEAMAALGISAFDAGGNAVQASELFKQLATALDGSTDAQKNQTLATIFGSDALKAVVPLVNAGATAIDDMMAKQKEAAGVTELSAARMNTLGGAFAEIEGTIITVLQNGFEPFAPLLHKATMGLSAFIKTISRVAQPVLNRFAAIMIGLTELSGSDLRNSIMGWLSTIRISLADGIKGLGRDIQKQWGRTITSLFGARSIDHRALLNSMAGGMQILINEAVDNLQGMMAGYGDQVRDMLTSALDWTGLPTIMDSLTSFFRVPANLGQSMSDAFGQALSGFVPEDVFDLDRRFAFLRNIRLPRLDFGMVEAEPPAIDTTNWLPGMTAPLTSVWDDTTNTFAGYLRRMGILGQDGNVIWQELGSRFWGGLTNIFSNVGQIFQGMGPTYDSALQQVAADSLATDPIIHAHTQAMGEIQRSMDELNKLSPGGHGDFMADLESNMSGLQNTIQDRVAFLGGPSLANRVQAAFAVIGQAFTQGWNLLTDTLENSEAMEFLTDYASDAWDWLTDWMDDMPGLDTIGQVFTGIGGAFSAGWAALSETWVQDVPDIGVIGAAFTSIRNALTAGWQSLQNFWQEGQGMDAQGRGASNIWADAMMPQDTSLAGSIRGAFAGINDALLKAAASAWDGVLAKIQEVAQPVLDWWQNLSLMDVITLPGLALDLSWNAVTAAASILSDTIDRIWDKLTGLVDLVLPGISESPTWNPVSAALDTLGSDLFDAWQKIKGLAAIYLPDIDMTALRLDINTLIGPTGPLQRLKDGWNTITSLAKAVLPSIDSTTFEGAVDRLTAEDGPIYRIVKAWRKVKDLAMAYLPELDMTAFRLDVNTLLGPTGPIQRIKDAWNALTEWVDAIMPGLDTTQLDLDAGVFAGPTGSIAKVKGALASITSLPAIILPTLDDSQMLPFRAEGQPSLYDRIDSVKAALDSLRNLPDITLPGINSTTLEADAARITGDEGPYAKLLASHGMVDALPAITLPAVEAPEVPDMDVDVPLSLVPSIDTTALEGIEWEDELGTALPALSERAAYQSLWGKVSLPLNKAFASIFPETAKGFARMAQTSAIPEATLSASGTALGGRMATALSRGLRLTGWTSLIVEGIWYGYQANKAGREQAVKARLEGSTEAQAAAEGVGRATGEFTESWAKSGFDLVLAATDLTTWVTSWIPTWVATIGEVRLGSDLFAGLADATIWQDFGEHVQSSFLASGTHQRMLGASDYLRDLVGFTPEDVSAWFQGLVTSGMNLAGTAMTSDWFLNLLRPMGTSMTMAMPTIDLTAFETNWGGKALGSIKEGLGQAVADMTPDWVRNNWLFDLWDSISNAFTSFTTLKYEVTWGQRIGDAIKGALQKALEHLTPDWLETNFLGNLWDKITGGDGAGTTGGGGGTGIDLGSMNVLRPGRYGGHDQGVQRMYGDDGFGGLDLPGLKGLQGNSGLAAMRTGAGLGAPGAGAGEENPMLEAVQEAMAEVAEFIGNWGSEEDILGKMFANLTDPMNEALQSMIEAGVMKFTHFSETLMGEGEGLIPMLLDKMMVAWETMFGVGDSAGAEGSLTSLLNTFATYNQGMTQKVVSGWMQVASAVINTVQSIESAIKDLMKQYEMALRLQQAVRRLVTRSDPNYGTFSAPNVVGRADGGMVMKHEYTMVGEKGPELVKLPAGSRVYPTGQGPGSSTTNNTEYRVTVVKQPGEDTVDAFRRDMAFRKFASAGA